MRAPVVLHALSSFDDSTLDHAASAIMSGLVRCVSNPGPLRIEITNSPDFWSILQRLHRHKSEAEHVFEMLQNIALSQPSTVSADNYESSIALANDFATAGSIGTIQEQRRDFAARRGKQLKPVKTEETAVVARAVNAVGIIYHLTGRIPSLIEHSHLERNEAWAAYWSPIFRALSAQCVNPCREVRHRAMSAFQRSLLSEHLASEDHTEWTAIFGEVLFPLILRLLKPEVYQLDQIGMGETRIQAATLLCKIFLRYLDHLANCGQMLELWLKILDLLDRMMNSGSEDTLAEAVPESLKNILLVMAGSGYITPPMKGEVGDQIWVETRKRLDRFLPDLLVELFPLPQAKEEPHPAGKTESGES
jgi:golgi-specific brefeldin A-resistance guanine nucleotide exchange factor 1